MERNVEHYKKNIVRFAEKYPLVVFFAVFLSFIFIIAKVNSFIEHDAKSQRAVHLSTKKSVGQKPASFSAKPARRTLTPDDPAKYGMIVTDPENTPRNQMQWDLYMDQVIKKSKILEQENAKPALAKMQSSPEEFQSRTKTIDERIAAFQKQKNENPSDEDAETHLQYLYMLRSLGKALEAKVTGPVKNSP